MKKIKKNIILITLAMLISSIVQIYLPSSPASAADKSVKVGVNASGRSQPAYESSGGFLGIGAQSVPVANSKVWYEARCDDNAKTPGLNLPRNDIKSGGDVVNYLRASKCDIYQYKTIDGKTTSKKVSSNRKITDLISINKDGENYKVTADYHLCDDSYGSYDAADLYDKNVPDHPQIPSTAKDKNGKYVGGYQVAYCYNLSQDMERHVLNTIKAYKTLLGDKFVGGATEGGYEASDTENDINDALEEGRESSDSCQVDGIGWIVCPVINFLASAADKMYNDIVQPFLEIKAGEWFASGGSLEEGWKTIRDLSNVILVLVLLIVIISQISGIGISNYGIKKMVPKLIIAAILANISYWVCALFVDISNILGSELYKVLSGMSTGLSAEQTVWGGGGLASIAGVILAGGAAVIAMVALGGTIIAIIVVALIAAWVALVARQAILIVLIVFAPLAFVAMVLPNTENWFSRWRKMLTTLLMVYPILGAVMGISGFASAIITGVAVDQQGDADTLLQIAGAMVAVLPLVAVPTILKKTITGLEGVGGAIGKLQTTLGGAGDKAARKTTKVAGYGLRKGGRAIGGQISKRVPGAGNLSGKISGAASRVRRFNNSINNYGENMKTERAVVDAEATVRDLSGKDNLSLAQQQELRKATAVVDSTEKLKAESDASVLSDQFNNISSNKEYQDHLRAKGLSHSNEQAMKYLVAKKPQLAYAAPEAMKRNNFTGGETGKVMNYAIDNMISDYNSGEADRRASAEKMIKSLQTTDAGSNLRKSNPSAWNKAMNETITPEPDRQFTTNYDEMSMDKITNLIDDEIKDNIDKFDQSQIDRLVSENNGNYMKNWDKGTVDLIKSRSSMNRDTSIPSGYKESGSGSGFIIKDR